MITRKLGHEFVLLAFSIFGVLGFIAQPAVAQTQQPGIAEAAKSASQRPLNVATKVAPPFAMQSEDGAWTGIAIELFEEMVRDLDRPIEWKNVETSDGIVEAVEAQSADLGIAAVSITAAREKLVDFSHAYYDSGLAIAVASNQGVDMWDVMKALTSPAFLTTVGTLILLLLATGAVIWFVERRKNSDQFQKEPVEGIGNGFWWAAVTMTTVGYGDKAPITPLGRVIAVVWMFAALILTAVFTAQLTTSLTLGGISGPVSGPNDLPRARVGILAKSATADYFDKRYINTTKFETLADGLQALTSEKIDAFVHDEPILRYTIKTNFSGNVTLLPQVFEHQGYGIVLAQDSGLREEVNQALLKVQGSPQWKSIMRRYLGEN